MLFADRITELSQLSVCPLVAPVRMVINKVHSIENDVVMAVTFVNMRSDYILIFSFEPFVRKLFSDLMSFFGRDLTDIKRLYQVTGDNGRNLRSLLGCKVARPLKFPRCGIAGSTSKRGNKQFIIGLFRVNDVGDCFVYSSSDWLDFSNCHISFCLSFSSATSSS